MNFKTPLITASMPDGRRKRVHTKFTYQHGSWTIVVPAGFVSDGASIPRIFWSIIGGPWGRYGKAAVLHDWLYFEQEYSFINDRILVRQFVSRKLADTIFMEAMMQLEVAAWRIELMYWAVRLCGWLAWRKNASV